MLDKIVTNAKNSSHFDKEILDLMKIKITEESAKELMKKEFSGSGLFELRHFIKDICKLKI